MLVIAIFVGAISCAYFALLSWRGRLRVDLMSEIMGLDIAEMGGEACPEERLAELQLPQRPQLDEADRGVEADFSANFSKREDESGRKLFAIR